MSESENLEALWQTANSAYLRHRNLATQKKGNLSILDRNILHGLASSCVLMLNFDLYDDAETIYLRFKDRGALKAEQLAYEWLNMEPLIRTLAGLALKVWTDTAPSLAELEKNASETKKEVIGFIKERLARMYFPDGRKA